MKAIEERTEIDIRKFEDSMSKVAKLKLTEEERKIVELAGMYASDSRAWMKKGDINTSFASICYAHGLLDAVLKLEHAIE